VAVDLALTGLLHVDGLADAADGLLPPLPRERRLAIMRQPDIGAFGVATVVVVLGLRCAALAAVVPPRPLLLAGLWALSRTGMAATVAFVPYARREGGLASRFRSRRPAALAVVVGVAIAVAALAGAWGWRGVVVGVVALVGGAGVVGLAVRRLGGFTGDVLGAAGLVAEVAGLVAATGWT
jgi:adenosylcobinamide-GDP ribazoletransferase